MKYKSLAAALYTQPWYATEDAVSTLSSILGERRSDAVISEEEIRQRIQAAGGNKVGNLLSRMREDYDLEAESPYLVTGSVAIIPLAGTLFAKANLMTQHSGATSYQDFARNLGEAIERTDIKQIVIDCDSPGGQVTGCKDLADTIYGLRGQGKKITAFVSGQCCSAAMYLASACDQIVSSPSSLLGSIGTLIMIRDTSEAYANAGIAVNVLRSSPLKAAGADGEKFEGARKQSMQAIVDQFGAQFEEDIAKYRGLSAAQVRERFGQGGVLTPKEAMAVGMIDQIAAWEDFFKPLAQQTSAPRSGSFGGKGMKYSQQVRMALCANGFIDSLDASDDVCKAALKGLGITAENPTVDQVNEKILGRMQAKLLPAATPEQIGAVLPGKPADSQDATERAVVAENNRVKELLCAKEQFEKLGCQIDATEFNALLADRTATVEGARKKWLDDASRKSPPVNQPGIAPVKSEYDQWHKICVEAMVQRSGGEKAADPIAQKWGNRRTAEIAREDLKRRGINAEGTDGEIIANWTRSCASSQGVVDLGDGLTANAYTGAGAFPNALGGVMNVMFAGAIQTNKATYSRWSERLPDAPDFRPSTIFSVGGEDEFDLNMTAKEPMQADIAEESTLITNAIYDKQFVWSPVMQANDNGALAKGVNGLGNGHELTLERLHYNLLVGGTANLGPDGQVVFSSGTITALTPAARGNAITSSGAGPTSAQLSTMRTYGLNQVWNKLNEDGSTYKRMFTGDMSKILVSHHWIETAEQTLYPFAQVGETKVPVTDATINRWRGRVEPIYMPLLNEQSDVKYWYAIFDAAAFIVHVFQSGFGAGGKKTVVVNMLTGAVHVKWEGRFGATYLHPQQGMVNYGS